jgi:hypothetical protein
LGLLLSLPYTSSLMMHEASSLRFLFDITFIWPTKSLGETPDFLCICNQIAAAISGASQVLFPREPVFLSFVIL